MFYEYVPLGNSLKKILVFKYLHRKKVKRIKVRPGNLSFTSATNPASRIIFGEPLAIM
jgi:hypothetical protein